MWRYLFKGLSWLMTFVLLLLLVLLFFLGTTPGLRLAMALVTPYVPDKLAYGKLSGSIVGGLIVNDFAYEIDGVRISAQRAFIRLAPWPLLHQQHLVLKKLVASHVMVDITAIPSDKKAALEQQQPVSPEPLAHYFPFFLKIDNARLEEVSFHYDRAEKPMTVGLLRVTGQAGPAQQDIAMHGQVQWQQLTIPLQALTLHASHGQVSMQGEPDHYKFQGKFAFAVDDFPEAQWAIRAQAGLHGIDFDSLQGKLWQGTAQGQGKISWQQLFDWQAALTFVGINPGVMWPDYPGKLAGQFTTQGHVRDNAFTAQFHLKKLAGTLKQWPVSGHSDFQIQQDRYTLTNTALKAGNNSLQLYAQYDKSWQAQGQLSVEDFLPKSLVPLRVAGQLKDKNLTLTAKHAHDAVSITGRVEQKAHAQQVKITALRLLVDPVGAWQLKKPANLSISDKSTVLSPLCLMQKTALFCAQGALTHQAGSTPFHVQLALQQGSVAVPLLGLNIRAVKAWVKSTSDKAFSYFLSAQSGKGTLTVAGHATHKNKVLQSETTIQGKNIQAADTGQFNVLVSPDLQLLSNKDGMTLTGQITLPTARIRPKDFSSTVEMPRNVRYVDAENNDAETDFPFYTDVKLQLGDDVRFEYHGLDAMLGGSLEINDKPDETTTANGQLSITQGHFAAYGQRLDIRKGRLLFSGGPIDNPNLDVEAVRHVDVYVNAAGNNDQKSSGSALTKQQVLVGVKILGSVEAPETSLFALPPVLNRSQILSYLVLGHDISSSSNTRQDSAALASAASALSLSNASIAKINNRIKSTLGLSDLDIGSQSEYDPDQDAVVQNTSLILGKYLTPNLYVKYSLGLEQAINTLTLQYFLSSKWSVQTQTNTYANGADLFYTLNRD